jgi:uncharacterized protein (TIGR03435 family)
MLRAAVMSIGPNVRILNQRFAGRDSLGGMKWFGLSTLMLLSVLWAQEKPAFEAASIHANISSEIGQCFFDLSGAGRLIARNMDVWDLVRLAFGLRDRQMAGGPVWIKSEGFDIQGTASATGTAVARPRALLMLQSLLEDRFHLRWHNEMREMAVYALRVATGGPKFVPAKEGQSGRMQMGDFSVPSMTMESLCQILEHETRRLVIDQTQLKDSYAIQLQWARDAAKDTSASELDASRPSLFTAVQEQLGLRLESARLAVKVFVIDEVQRPSRN